MHERHPQRLLQTRIARLIAEGGEHRHNLLQVRVGPLFADFSRCLMDEQSLAALVTEAEQADVPAAIKSLMSGERINVTEDRAVLHALLRTPIAATPATLREEVAAIAHAREQMSAWEARLDQEGFSDGNRVRHVINVGIGGSDLGPRLLIEALPAKSNAPELHFLSGVDGHAIASLIDRLNPAETLVVMVSKSFATRETLVHGELLRQWLVAALGAERARERVFAVTARPSSAIAIGVEASRVLPIWDWVGGRYSIWSAVSFAAMLRIGSAAFDEFLAGAHLMDTHFQTAALAQNLPVLAALLGFWHRSVLGYGSLCVVPYDPRLREFPHYLQQLEMESNGKSVRLDGTAVDGPAVPVVWGGIGTDVQHAFFQALHQGTDVVPVDFIGVIKPDHAHSTHHQALLANLLAQSAALSDGTDAGMVVDAHRHHPGNRPSSVYLLDSLSPRALGALIALYEHKVFVQSRLWGVNAFDQWGVELGKKLATSLESALASGRMPESADAVTIRLIEEIRARS